MDTQTTTSGKQGRSVTDGPFAESKETNRGDAASI